MSESGSIELEIFRQCHRKTFMTKIDEPEFARICDGIYEDRKSIFRHNPVGTERETLLWMLLGALTVYLNLTEIETPCFNGMPTAETYREAILFVLNDRMNSRFDAEKYLNKLTKEN
ncbi:MAG: hypothetical protein ACR2N3_10235 [Pyrinomonadaceae bacterium]